jgi:hypothetical protein
MAAFLRLLKVEENDFQHLYLVSSKMQKLVNDLNDSRPSPVAVCTSPLVNWGFTRDPGFWRGEGRKKEVMDFPFFFEIQIFVFRS